MHAVLLSSLEVHLCLATLQGMHGFRTLLSYTAFVCGFCTWLSYMAEHQHVANETRT